MQYIEYIQNGTTSNRVAGWSIPLNYHPSITTNVVMKVKTYTPRVTTDGNLLVGHYGNNGNYFRLFSYQSGTMCFDSPNDSNLRLSLAYSDTAIEWEMGAIDNNSYYLKNYTDNTETTGTTSLNRTFNGDFAVYGWDANRDILESQRIYYIEIYENNVKVKDYRPVIDNNNVVCLYEEIGGTYHYNAGDKTLTAGPVLSSIFATPSKTSLKATGETINIVVTCENAWTLSTSGDSFLTLSSTGDTGGTTITATAPSYSGVTPREVYITFTDTTTSDTAILKIKQKKYQSGQPFYLGGDEVGECYIGDGAVTEAYLGEDLVFSTGPFVGLKVSPKSLNFNENNLTASIKVKASESWTMTTPAWVTASTLTGDTGETIVTLTATTQTAATSDIISIASTSFSASVSTNYYLILFGGYVDIVGPANVVLPLNPYVDYAANHYLRFEMNLDFLNRGYLLGGGYNSQWFSLENGWTDAYWNLAKTTGAISNVPNTNGYNSTYILTVDNNTASDNNGKSRYILGDFPDVSIPMAPTGSATNLQAYFYEMKVYNSPTNLLYDFVGAFDGENSCIYDKVSGNKYYPSGTGTITYHA